MKIRKLLIITAVVFAAVTTVFLGCSNMLSEDPNRYPEASVAGTNYTVYRNADLKLDGSKSFDVDDQPLTYRWKVTSPSNSQAILENADTSTATFHSDVEGAYTIDFTVTDEYGLTDSRTVTVNVSNTRPTVSFVNTNFVSIPLNGAYDTLALEVVSNDPDPSVTPLTHSWRVVQPPAGAKWSWDGSTNYGETEHYSGTAKTAVWRPDSPGAYRIACTATDEYGLERTAYLVVQTSDNTAPQLAGGAPAVTVVNDTRSGSGTSDDPFSDDDTSGSDDNNDTFSLDAETGVTNTENDVLTYTWRFADFTGTLNLFVDGVETALNPGGTIVKVDDGMLTIAPINHPSTPDGNADFSVEISVSDKVTPKDDTNNPIFFDLY